MSQEEKCHDFVMTPHEADLKESFVLTRWTRGRKMDEEFMSRDLEAAKSIILPAEWSSGEQSGRCLTEK